MFNCLLDKSDPVYIVYKLKQKNIDTIIEETTKRKLKNKLKKLKLCTNIGSKIVYDTILDNAIKKFYN